MKFCKHCASQDITLKEQIFRDGSTHIRQTCNQCTAFLGYAKQNNGFDRTVWLNFRYNSDEDLEHLVSTVVEKLTSMSSDLRGHSVSIFLKAR